MSAEETHRYYLVEPQIYDSLQKQIDITRGFPQGKTLRGLPLREELSVDIQGRVLIAVDKWRFIPEDTELIAPYISSGKIVEITRDEWWSILYPEDDITELEY